MYQFLVATFAAVGSILFGYDLAVIQEVVASGNFIHLFLQQNQATRSGTVVALFTAGAFFGAFFSSWFNMYGRRGTICLGACVFIVGGIIQTAAQNIAMMYSGRLIALTTPMLT